ncbi:MAG: [FeFe] hydrogenase H-cluster maturation GTPase HydF [Coriobacteriales bacterium]
MSDLASAPKGSRLRIVFLGRRNVGKSSLINALTRQETSLVSATAGTTTDPVEKHMELKGIGPVVIVDTAGTDDEGELGLARVGRTKRELARADVVVLVCEQGAWGDEERKLCDIAASRSLPLVIAFSKADLADGQEDAGAPDLPERAQIVSVSSTEKRGIDDLAAAIVRASGQRAAAPEHVVSHLVPYQGLAVLVTPIDSAAPTGRLILPQVQAIRDLLDGHCSALVVQTDDLAAALARLDGHPDIVVTDSQAFAEVDAIVPPEVPMTSFSILFARLKGDLTELVAGAGALATLKPGDRVLISEACTHRSTCEDIGTVKIPRLLEKKLCPGLVVEHSQGVDFPDDLSDFKLVIHCGSCMLNRAAMLSRMQFCKEAGVPITNYGMTVAHALGILPRALQPIEGALEAYEQAMGA